MIRLTDEEIQAIVDDDFARWQELGITSNRAVGETITKAQLKKVVNEWDGYGEYAGCKLIPMGEWQALLEEVK